MSKLVPILIALLTLTVSSNAAAQAAHPEAETQVLLDAIRANRDALVGVNLQLTPEEATAFWPVYDRYRKDINEVGDRILAIVDDYIAHFSDLQNDKALQITEDYLAAEAERLKIRRSYLSEFAKILPGRTVARLYQLENKFDAVLRYDLARTIPVVEEPRGGAAK